MAAILLAPMAALSLIPAALADEPAFAGRSINAVGPPPPGFETFADNGFRQQNEPSCAVNPENPNRICCGFNDYRGVDIPGLGESWQGLSCSIDGGASWSSQLIPGHRLDPEYSLGLEFAADPNLVSIPGGLIFNFIAAQRDKSRSGLYVQRYLWRNKETGWPLQQVGGPITIDEDRESPFGQGLFLDKPHMAGLLHSGSAPPVRWAGTERDLPAGTLIVAAASFAGVEPGADIAFLTTWRSDDWGETWNRIQIGEGPLRRNSGLNIAANGDQVCVVWRRFEGLGDSDAILYRCSDDRGINYRPTKVLADICPFDLVTLAGDPPLEPFVSFRSNAFPVIAADGDRFYTFWSDRGYAAASDGPAGCSLTAPGDDPEDLVLNPSFGRIVYSVSADGGETWSAPQPVEDHESELFPGHQLMPAAFGANGEVFVAWIDTRDDVVNQFRALGLDPPQDKQLILDIWDEGVALYRHSADIRGIRLRAGSVRGDSVKVSNYARGLVDFGAGPELLQLEYNLVNARLFQQGTAPFIGDYLNVTADAYTLGPDGDWRDSNTEPVAGSFVFFVSNGDNRDLRGNAWGEGLFGDPSPYTPPAGEDVAAAAPAGADDAAPGPADADGAKVAFGVPDSPDPGALSCEAAAEPQDRTRDQNVYTTAVYPRYSLESPGAIKLSGPGLGDGETLRRAVPVILRNNTSERQQLELRIDAQPSEGSASFGQDDSLSLTVPVTIWGQSSAVRTVFINTPDEASSSRIPVSAAVCDDTGDCEAGSVAQVLLNETLLALEQPDYGDRSVQAQELHDPTVLNRSVLNTDVVRILLQDPALIDVLVTAGLLPPGFTIDDLFNPVLIDPALLDTLQSNPDLLSPENLDPELLALLLANFSLLERQYYETDPLDPLVLVPTLLLEDLLEPGFWALLREGDNLALLIDGVANPDLLEDLANNPGALNPDLLNLLVNNPNLLNPDLLNALVANPSLLNFELDNPNLLNPNLLNTVVSNPNLLNPAVLDGFAALADDPLYPVEGTEQERLDYIAAGYATVYPELLNAVLVNPNLLNPNLLNPNLLNPTLLNALVANPTLLNPNLLNTSLLNPSALNPNLLNPNLLNPDLLNPDLLNQLLLNPNLLNELVANPNLLNPNLLNPNLLNETLLDQVVDNPNLLNPNLLNPNVLNPNLLNPNLLNAPLDAYSALENPQALEAPAEATPGEDSYIDVTWQVRNEGNTTTGYLTQPFIVGATEEELPEGVSASQLIISKPYLQRTTSECQQALVTYNNVIVNVPNPRVEEPLLNPDPTDPATSDIVSGLGSFWLAPGEVANVTMRLFGDADKLGLDLVGIYISSESCNSGVNPEDCKDDVPFIRVEPDKVPPAFVAPEVFLEQFSSPFEAEGPEGAVLDYLPPEAVDNVDGDDVAVSCERPSGAAFPVGVSSNVCTASDRAGNESYLPFEVAVEDTTPPLLSIPDGPLVQRFTGTGEDGDTVDYDVSGLLIEDLVDGVIPPSPASLTCNPPGGSVFPYGTTVVSCIANDAAGNLSEPVDFEVILERAAAAEARILFLRPRSFPLVAREGSLVRLRWGYRSATEVDNLALLGEPTAGSIAPVEIRRLSLDSSCDGSAIASVDAGPGSSLKYSVPRSGRAPFPWTLRWRTGSSVLGSGDESEGRPGPGCYEVAIPRTDGVTDVGQVILKPRR